jgi:hypothetical protein
MNNLQKAVIEFREFKKEMPTASYRRRKKIREEAVVCHDLMIYSVLVADTQSAEWRELDSLVKGLLGWRRRPVE